VVKTIGDAVMATFPTPDKAVAAALRMRDAMAVSMPSIRARIRAQDRHPRRSCLGVSLNDRQDYFARP